MVGRALSACPSPHLEPLRLEDDAGRAPRAPPVAPRGRALDLERGAGAVRPARARRRAARSRGTAGAARRRAGRLRGVRRRVKLALTATTIAVFLGSWSLLHHGAFTRDQIVDTSLYQQYGENIAHGQVPYRDFRPEYPPGALPVFVLPALGHEGDSNAYDRWFDRLMALCGCIAIAGAALVLRALDAGRLRTSVALGLIGISPLLVGPVVLSRFDLWPTALAVLAIAALLWERLALAAIVLGTAIGAKLWPVVLAPLAVAWIWKRRGR